MPEDEINYRLMNQKKCHYFVCTSYYGDQTHCETFDSDSQLRLEICQAGYLLKYTRTLQLEKPRRLLDIGTSQMRVHLFGMDR